MSGFGGGGFGGGGVPPPRPSPAAGGAGARGTGGFGGRPIKVELTGPLFDGRGEARLLEYLRIAMRASAARIEGAAARLAPVNTGALRSSFGAHFLVRDEGGRFTAALDGGRGGLPKSLSVAVGSSLPYGPFVEHGTKPSRKWPPKAPIEAWVRRKLGGVISEMAAEGGGDRAKARSRALASLVFLVRRKIGTRGTNGAKMLAKALKSERVWVIGAFRAAVQKWAREVG